MKRKFIRFGPLVFDRGHVQRNLHPIGCGGPGWTATHWFWRFYWARKRPDVPTGKNSASTP